jgi:hypothetical protein
MKVLWLLLALLAIPAVLGVSITSISITPSNATTTATLSCLVNATGTGTLTANITWYRSGMAHISDNEGISLTTGIEGSTSTTGNIEAVDTTKGDNWQCQATVGNTTATVVANSSTVTITNSPPTLLFPTTNQTAPEDVSYNQVATATDADGDAIVVYISSDLNASLYGGIELFDILTNGTIAFVPAQNLIGNHSMAILAYDGTQFGGQNILYTVTPVDDAPEFVTVIADQSGNATFPFVYTITAQDEENDSMNFSMVSNSSALRIQQISPTQVNVSFAGVAPDYTDKGYYEVNLTVYQNSTPAKNTTVTFHITVSAPDRAPYLFPIANQTGIQGAPFSLIVNATDNDTTNTLFFGTTSNCSITNPWIISTDDSSPTTGVGNITLTLTNSHVVCNYVTIYVEDREMGIFVGGNVSQTVFMNITNINDIPTIANISNNISNTRNQTDLRSLNASTFEPFLYAVSANDVDTLTPTGDTITFTDNTTLFAIDNVTGVISFTPTISDVGNYLVRITVTDLAGETANATLNITVINNGAPSITPVSAIVCQEDAACEYNFTGSDPDNDNLTFIENSTMLNLTWFSTNITKHNRTYTNTEVGNYSVNLSVSDYYSHTNSTTFTLQINNTPDAPFFDNNRDNTSDTLAMPAPVVITYPVVWLINITDPDTRNVAENATFTSTITAGVNTSLFTIQKLSNTQARIAFTAGEADIGQYTVNITVNDSTGLEASELVNFTVRNISASPVITAAQPFWNGSSQSNTTLYTTSAIETSVDFAENTTAYFNVSFTDVDSVTDNITVYYYRNGVQIAALNASVASNYTMPFDFFSAGTFDINATVRDELYSTDSFVWHVTVANLNRPPILQTNFSNRTINSTTLLAGEMDNFYDPDDDTDNSGTIDANETNSLTFAMTPSSFVTASFSGSDLTLTPLASGAAIVVFTATDAAALQASSLNVTYTIFFTETDSSSSSSSSSGGGGGSSTVIPQRITDPEPYAIDIITPKPLTVFENETVVAPLGLKNTGDLRLRDITLTAASDANVTLSFLDSTIDELVVGEEYNTSLVITNYISKGSFEVRVTATVADPSFNDSAVFYINSLEKLSSGDEVNTKITYARDLLAGNPACGELVQLIDQAEVAYRNNDVATAIELLDAVTEGCTYLKAQTPREIENPTLMQTLAGYQYVNVVLGGLLVVLLLVGGMLLTHYARQQ